MTIYLATSGFYSDYRVNGVFSTAEKAATFNSACQFGEPSVDAREVDEFQDDSLIPVFLCVVKADGSVDTPYSNTFTERKSEMNDPNRRQWVRTRREWFMGEHRYRGVSTRSPEHALKLAAEVRQAHLRETQGTQVDPPEVTE